MRDVQFELALSVVLVVLVIYLFLANVWATLIPSLSVPLSLIGTLAVMYLCGFSLDNLSLMALTIATGFVVDDAIVMIENIARYVEEGETPLEAALKGSKQIGFTIISLTVSLIAVLIPLLFMGDVVGRLFHEFAITLAVTIVISAVVSLTLVPMMCAKLLRHTPPKESHRFEARAHQFIDYVIARYARRADLGAGPAALDAVRRAAHAGADRPALRLHSEGLLPDAGYRRDPGDHAGAAVGVVSSGGRAAAGARRADPEEPGRGKPDLVHRRGRHQHHAEQRPDADQPEAARRPQQHLERRDPRAAERRGEHSRASSSTCSRCRI